MFGTNYLHNVNNNLIRDIEQIEEWEAFKFSILYKGKKIEFTEAEILRELPNMWPIFNRAWPKYRNDKKSCHIKLFDHISSHYTITREHLCQMLRILLAVAPLTELLEHKDRNQLSANSLETLYLLSTLKNHKLTAHKPLILLRSKESMLFLKKHWF